MRAVDVSADCKRVLVGTLGSELYEIKFKKGAEKPQNCHPRRGALVTGHCAYVLHGVGTLLLRLLRRLLSLLLL